MLDWEEDANDNFLGEDLERFEGQLAVNAVGFYDADRLEAIIDHYLINGNYTKAKTAAEVGISQFPFHSLFLVRKAQSMSGMGQLREALTILTKAESMESATIELILTKAAIYSQLRDSKRAIRFFQEALVLAEEEDRDEIYLDLATEMEQLKDFNGAIKVLEEAMKANPKNEGALYELAYCFDQLGDFQKAVQSYTNFLDDNPYSFTAWYNLGNTYSKVEDFDNALQAYEYCVAINENFPAAYFNMGNAYLTLEKYHLSIECFQQCIDMDGDDALTYCYLGEAYEQLEELDTAWDYYQKSLSLAPKLAEAWLGLGIIKDLQGKSKDSIHYIERAIEIEPKMDGYYHVYAGALENCDRLEDAQQAYLKCLEIEPENEDAFFDYVDYLIEHKIAEVRCFVEEFMNQHHVFFSLLPLIYLNWMAGRTEETKLLITEAFDKNPEKTKEVFIRYPELANVTEFVDLTQN